MEWASTTEEKLHIIHWCIAFRPIPTGQRRSVGRWLLRLRLLLADVTNWISIVHTCNISDNSTLSIKIFTIALYHFLSAQRMVRISKIRQNTELSIDFDTRVMLWTLIFITQISLNPIVDDQAGLIRVVVFHFFESITLADNESASCSSNESGRLTELTEVNWIG